MRPTRVRPTHSVAAALLAIPLTLLTTAPRSPAASAEGYKIEDSKDAPPAELTTPVRDVLAAQGFRVLDPRGKPYAEIWLRKAVPAKARPGAPNGPIHFSFLAEGELLGAVKGESSASPLSVRLILIGTIGG